MLFKKFKKIRQSTVVQIQCNIKNNDSQTQRDLINGTCIDCARFRFGSDSNHVLANIVQILTKLDAKKEMR